MEDVWEWSCSGRSTDDDCFARPGIFAMASVARLMHTVVPMMMTLASRFVAIADSTSSGTTSALVST